MPRRISRPPPVDLAALSPWAPELAETFAALASDVALVLDEQGVIVKVAQHATQPLLAPDWVGKAWVETVTVESRVKVDQMLSDVANSGIARQRQLNHPQDDGSSVAVAYTAVRLGENGATLAVGHDLRAQAEMQQRFVQAQQALEQSYWKSQQELAAAAGASAANGVTGSADRERLGLAVAHPKPQSTDNPSRALVRALDGLQERIGQEALPGLLRDAKRLIEQHFLQQALARTGSEAALARELGISTRALARRKRQAGYVDKPPRH
jgi:hypothetical protein